MKLFDFIKSNKSKTTNTNLNKKIHTSLPPLENPHTLPTCVENFKEWHIKVLRRLNKHPVNEPFSGIMTIEVDIPNFIPVLQELNLIDFAFYDDALRFTKNETLKTILKHFNLKVSGNKEELVQRILNNTSDLDVRSLKEYSDYYILTTLGQKVVDESYIKFEQKRLAFFKTSVDLIVNLKPDEAFRLICKRNAEAPISYGLNFDWEEAYYKGLNNSSLYAYISKLESSSDKLLTACSIYSEISGDSLRTIQFNLRHAYNVETEIITDITPRLIANKKFE